MRSLDRKPLNMGIAGVEPRHQQNVLLAYQQGNFWDSWCQQEV
jgi:hypothetical protein